tara:strand:+ start:308 stop:1705 length:1398 start_codon:yes stop_codon:yes gene_type:complete
MSFRKIKNIHFVGIGGIGMSGIAELLLNLKFKISGSDISTSENTERLNRLGVKVTIGHDPKNVGEADALVYSSAVQDENSEIIKARQVGIPVIKRAEMLAELISFKETSIAIGGTHGKTSTSSLVGSVLSNCNLDPTLVVGGLVQNLNTNSKLGDGNIIVVEADEYDRSFLALKPTIGIITNIELEHTDCYNDLDDLQNAFLKFSKSVPFYGEVIVCIDSPGVREILTKIERPMTTYGKSRDAVYRAKNIRFRENKSTYSVFRSKENLGEIQVALPGEHNVLNSLAAVTVGLEMGLSFQSIQSSLKKYDGVRRRFDIKTKNKNIIVVDDYAHHPTEIEVTLKAAKGGWDRRIIAVFQPHLFSRTKSFFREFAQSLQLADMIFITNIYPAREAPIPGISSELIYIECINMGHKLCYLVPDFNDIPKKLDRIIQDNDMIITLGAGNIWRFSEEYALHLEKNIVGVKN